MELVGRGQNNTSFAVRPFQEGDFAQMEEIEREVFPTMVPHTSFRREFRNRIAHYFVIYEQSRNINECTRISNRRPSSISIFRSRIINNSLGKVREFFSKTFSELHHTEQVIVGFIGVWYIVQESHIVSIAVRPEYRRQGFGELLLIGAIEHAMKFNINSMTLEVRVSNCIARNLYAKYNFCGRGLRKRYYTDDREDALIMTNDNLCQIEYRSRFYKLLNIHQRTRDGVERSLT